VFEKDRGVFLNKKNATSKVEKVIAGVKFFWLKN
jgi:hypothetical protein